LIASNPNALANDPDFTAAVSLAQSTFLSQKGFDLGRLISVQTQVVSGTNYKMQFEAGTAIYEIIVYVQPWTNTHTVISLKQISTDLAQP
jgi:hypothetical protein